MEKKNERILRIYNILKRKNVTGTKKIIKDIASDNISEMTIRRCLKELETMGLIKCHYGNIELLKSVELDFQANANYTICNYEKKLNTAEKGIDLVHENDLIFVSSGTTMEIFVSKINRTIKTLVTNGVDVFKKAINNSNIKDAIMIGGYYNRGTDSVIGIIAEEQVKNFYFNSVFLSFDHLGDDLKVYSDDFQETHFLKNVIANSKEKILLCDTEKFHSTGLCVIGELNDFSILVHDGEIDNQFLRRITQAIKIL